MPDDKDAKPHPKTAVLKRYLLSLAIGASTTTADTSDSYDEAIIAYLNDQYETAIRHLKISAGEGYPQAKHLLGTMYLLGLGTGRDEYEGFRWCKEAADNGHVDAQFRVGLMYLEGEGTTENEYEAMKWLSLAAGSGHKDAEEVLHVLLYEDFGVGC